MNITSTVVTRTGNETTENAFYILEYILVNDVLTRIHAIVQATLPESGENQNVGYITCENGTVFCNLNRIEKFSPFLVDFEMFVEKIKKSAGEMGPSENLSGNQTVFIAK